MEGLKRVHGLASIEQDSLWNMFEYMCNEDQNVIDLYIDDLRIIAKLLEIDSRMFVEMTGCEPFTLDEYLDKLYEDEI